MTIKFDRSESTVLTTCTECPYWYSLQLTQHAAYLSSEGHQVRVHDVDPHDAEAPRRLWAARLAEKARKARHAAKS